jgi:hypothetical protein
MELFWKTFGEVKGVADLDRWGDPLQAAASQTKDQPPFATRVAEIQTIYRITRHYLLLEDLALTALQGDQKQDKDRFMASYQELNAALDSEAGRALPNRDKLLVRVKDVFGALAGARPKYARLQSAGDYLWGDFDYKVDGLMRAAEAARMKNIIVRTNHLAIAPRSEGSIEWEFRAPDGAAFRRARAACLAIWPSKDHAEVLFAISTNDGQTWRTAHQSARPEAPIDFTPLVAGAKAFLLRVSAANQSDEPWNMLEDLRIELSAN